MVDELERKAHGCLIGGLIGDAMGTATENLEPPDIEARFGWVEDFEGTGTDDSLMKDFLCDALLATGGYATSDDWAAEILRNRARIDGKRDKFFASILHLVRKLAYGYGPRQVSAGNMPSSSSAMAIAPVGIVNAGHPRAAAAQAQEIASLIHVGDVAFCQDAAAAIAAAVAAAFVPGARVEDVVEASTTYLAPIGGQEMRRLIEDAVGLARETGDYAAFRAAYHGQYRRAIACDSRETAPATIALVALANGDPRLAITYGTNFGRDTDTIATMAGAICGALTGLDGFPPAWVEKADRAASRGQADLAARLVALGRDKARQEVAAWQRLIGDDASDRAPIRAGETTGHIHVERARSP